MAGRGNREFTRSKVIAILDGRAKGRSISALAMQFDSCYSTIRQIVEGITYKEIFAEHQFSQRRKSAQTTSKRSTT
jgi:hypothetical protein